MSAQALSGLKEHTMEEVYRPAQARRIPCVPVNTIKEIVSSEQLAHRVIL